jgi:hypothetical protein
MTQDLLLAVLEQQVKVTLVELVQAQVIQVLVVAVALQKLVMLVEQQ